MKRRKFLTITGLAVLSVPVIGYVKTSLEDATAGILQNEFHYLNLDKEGVKRFVHDYLIAYPPTSAFTIKVKASNLIGLKASNARLKRVSQLYLLSTNFFMNRMDESKIVKYIGLHHPYRRPCSNPFSQIFYPQK